jgi:hypothetical protein
VAALILYLIFALLFSGLAGLIGAFGLWVYSKFRFLELELVDAKVVDTQESRRP